MAYVYIIRSETFNKIYTGRTFDLERRMSEHNSGKSSHTNKYKPWKLVCYFAFNEENKAREFERYLKTGSGIAFARRHFISKER